MVGGSCKSKEACGGEWGWALCGVNLRKQSDLGHSSDLSLGLEPAK